MEESTVPSCQKDFVPKQGIDNPNNSGASRASATTRIDIGPRLTCVRACVRVYVCIVYAVLGSRISCCALCLLRRCGYIHRSLFLTACRVTRQRTRGDWGGRRKGDLCELTCLSAYVATFPNTRRGIREPTNRFIIARFEIIGPCVERGTHLILGRFCENLQYFHYF